MSDTPPPIYSVPPPPSYVQPPKPKRGTGWIVFAVIVCFFLMLSVLANFGLLAMLGGGETHRLEPGRSIYQEQFVMGDEDAKDKIVEIPLTGIISYNREVAAHPEGMVGAIKDQLNTALRDEHVKAIVLRINSPGGEVVASDAIYRALAAARDSVVRPIKIVAYVETVGASGAYYSAMGTDHIVANDVSITASIGVIMQTMNFGPYDDANSLMHKLGIRTYTFKSGNLKDILNPTRTPTDEETKLVKDLIMEVYEKFVGIVAHERGLDLAVLKAGIADGRIVSGSQAKAAGLVDTLGYYEDAVATAENLAGIKSARVIRYIEPFSLRNVFRFLGENEQAKIKIEVSPNPLKLRAGELYLLPGYLFQ